MIDFTWIGEEIYVYRLAKIIGVIKAGEFLSCSRVSYTAAELKKIAEFINFSLNYGGV